MRERLKRQPRTEVALADVLESTKVLLLIPSLESCQDTHDRDDSSKVAENMTGVFQSRARTAVVFSCFAALSMFVVLGFLVAVAIPLGHMPDEDRHWTAALEAADSLKGLDIQESRISYSSVFSYPSVAIATSLSELLGQASNSNFSFLLSRCLNGLFVFMILARLVFHFLKSAAPVVGVLTLLAFVLSPLFLQQSFVVSTDALETSFSLCLLISCLFGYQWSRVDMAILFTSGALSLASKNTMVWLAMAVATFLIVQVRWNPPAGTRKLKIVILFLLLFVPLSLGKSFYDLGRYDPRHASGLVAPRGSNPKAQIQYCLGHPFSATSLLAATFSRQVTNLDEAFGLGRWGPFNWRSSRTLPVTTTYYLWMLGILLMFSLDLHQSWGSWRRDQEFSAKFYPWRRRLLASMILMGGVFAAGMFVVSILYTIWTPVGLDSVYGVQYRYYFPLIIVGVGGINALAHPWPGVWPRNAANDDGQGKLFAALCVSALLAATYLSAVFIDIRNTRR